MPPPVVQSMGGMLPPIPPLMVMSPMSQIPQRPPALMSKSYMYFINLRKNSCH